METTNYYRQDTYTTPIASTLHPSAVPKAQTNTMGQPQMTEIYNQIFTGLQQMADGSDDSRSKDFDEVDSIPRGHLTVDTRMRADDYYDPKAIGLDSSGYPIDSADYERALFEQQNFNNRLQETRRTSTIVLRRHNDFDDGSLARRRRFEPISMPYYHNDTNHWHRQESYYRDGYIHDLTTSSYRDSVDEDDDEDYFG